MQTQEQEKTNPSLTVFSQKLAGQLMTMGFVLKGMGKNPQFPERNVFYFSDSDKIRGIVKAYSNKREE